MSYHSTIFTNKEIRNFFSEDELKRLVLITIKGKPARTKNKVVEKNGVITFYGSDFVAKMFLKGNYATNGCTNRKT